MRSNSYNFVVKLDGYLSVVLCSRALSPGMLESLSNRSNALWEVRAQSAPVSCLIHNSDRIISHSDWLSRRDPLSCERHHISNLSHLPNSFPANLSPQNSSPISLYLLLPDNWGDNWHSLRQSASSSLLPPCCPFAVSQKQRHCWGVWAIQAAQAKILKILVLIRYNNE